MDVQTAGKEIIIPKLGLTMTEATIVEWLKPEGTWVEKGEPVFALENEKASLEIEAPDSGFLRILEPAGATIPVLGRIGLLIPRITPAKNTIQEQASPVARILDTTEPAGLAEGMPGRQRASPKARALARKHGLHLADLPGSGPGGMIVSADLQPLLLQPLVKASPLARRLAAQAGLDLTKIEGSGPRGQIMREDIDHLISRPAEPIRLPIPPQQGKPAALPLSGLRGVIAERLTASWRERPQVTLTSEADAANLVSARQQIIAETGQKIPYDAFLVAIVCRALREHPQLNARLGESGIEVLTEMHIGVAIDTERGLLVPVLRHAHQKTLAEIWRELAALSGRALAGKSLPDDLIGGTFTITNLGMYEIDAFTPIINPPECAILGVGRILARPVGVNGQIVLREMMALSLSFDHRLVDGGPAARFLQRIKQLIERPFSLTLGGD
jgi:pyruvate dehydrogenase E2 component (dihydrolipoamide acetyltransferase)